MSNNNESERRETVADIVAAMRAMARVSETFVDRFSNPCLRMEMEMEAKMRKRLADRIEAAWKRERDRLASEPRSWAECVERAMKARENSDELY